MATPNFSDKNTTPKPPKLLNQVRDKLRVKHYSIRTEQTYLGWIKRYIYFHDKTHPKDLGAQDIEAFLTHLAVAGKVSASTQNLAKSSLLFLYREVLEIKLPWLVREDEHWKVKLIPCSYRPFDTRRAYCSEVAMDTSRHLALNAVYGG